jgi:alanine racemase
MLLSKIYNILGIETSGQFQDREIKTILYDSRLARGDQSELFVAIRGSKQDGHDYLERLLERGVSVFLVSSLPKIEESEEVNFLLVNDTLKALQQLVAVKRTEQDLPVVGITGSNGKTIVKEWLASILSENFHIIKSPKSFNSQLGVPISVWGLEKGHEIGIFEAGISKTKEMAKLQAIIQPTIGIFTNIGGAHDAGFANRKEKLTEKALLFEDTIINICRYEHTEIRELLASKKGELITWGIGQPEATINIKVSETSYHFVFRGTKIKLTIGFTNAFDLENIFQAIVCSVVLGQPEHGVQKALDKLKPIPMRLELKRGLNGSYILDDTYNNDLSGLSIALDYLLQQPLKKEKTVILSDILQSGMSNQELYNQVNDLLQKHEIGHLIGIGPQISKSAKCFQLPFISYPDTLSFLKEAPTFQNQMILVKGARDFQLEQLVALLEEKNHGTVLEVNNEAILHNLKVYQGYLATKTKLMVMVKAFAYGIGVDEIAHLLQYHQVDYLGVAYLDEAINLRRKGIDIPVMIMNVSWESFSVVEAFGLEPEIYSFKMLERYLADCQNPPPIHLKIETGMHRLGVEVSDLLEIIKIIKKNPQLKVAGIFTHFSSSEDPAEDAYTREQAEKFNLAYDQLTHALGYLPLKHAVNSSGIVRRNEYHFDMVRLGIGLYGFDSTPTKLKLRPVTTLKSWISQVKQVKQGDTIGYNRKGFVNKDGLVATVAIGYADGYSRTFGNGKAYMLVNGQKARTIGNVCMDMTMLDITGLDVKDGDEVIVFGEAPTIVDLAKWSATIPYEILTNVSQRVKRVFVSE